MEDHFDAENTSRNAYVKRCHDNSVARLKALAAGHFELRTCNWKPRDVGGFRDTDGPVIYFIQSAVKDEIIYIGATTHLASRCSKHYKRFSSEMSHDVFYTRVPDVIKTFTERYFIVEMRPKHNGQWKVLLYRDKSLVESLPFPRSIEYVAALSSLRFPMFTHRYAVRANGAFHSAVQQLYYSAELQRCMLALNDDFDALGYILNVDCEMLRTFSASDELNTLSNEDKYLDIRCFDWLLSKRAFELAVIRGEITLPKN